MCDFLHFSRVFPAHGRSNSCLMPVYLEGPLLNILTIFQSFFVQKRSKASKSPKEVFEQKKIRPASECSFGGGELRGTSLRNFVHTPESGDAVADAPSNES